MKKWIHILMMGLFILSIGQSLFANPGHSISNSGNAFIQPVHSADDANSFPPAALILNGAASAEVSLTYSGNPFLTIVECESLQDDDTRRKANPAFRKWISQQLDYRRSIDRHFTYRELIFPFHFHL